MPATIAYIALGGNLGNVRETFAEALRHLAALDASSCVRTSRLYRTAPWGDPDQPDYLNLVAELEWSGTLDWLARAGFSLERRAGRDRANERRWGPRTLDIDILLFGDQVNDSPELRIPHPRMAQRRFVLVPLADLAPDRVPPGWERTIRQALEVCEDEGEVNAVTDDLWREWCDD